MPFCCVLENHGPEPGVNHSRRRAMTGKLRYAIASAFPVALLVAVAVRVASISTPRPRGLTTPPPAMRTLDRLPLAFEANQGQTDPRVRFLARGRGFSLFLARNESVLVLDDPARTDRASLTVRAERERED